MPSNHLILCQPLLLPSVFPSIRVFPNELSLHIRWPNHCSFSFSISLSSEYSGLVSYVVQKKQNKPLMVSMALDTVSIPSSTPCSGARPCSGCWGSNDYNRRQVGNVSFTRQLVSPDPNRLGHGCGSFPILHPLNLGIVTRRWGNRCQLQKQQMLLEAEAWEEGERSEQGPCETPSDLPSREAGRGSMMDGRAAPSSRVCGHRSCPPRSTGAACSQWLSTGEALDPGSVQGFSIR